MNVLFIGGTGNISTAVSRRCVGKGIDLTLLTRRTRWVEIPGAHVLEGDITNPAAVTAALGAKRWDAVVNWIAYLPSDVERDIALFRGKTRQYVFISSASAYQKPPSQHIITESTPLHNPFWEYSRNKIACEELLMRAYRDEGFPTTIVRPSHTYDTVIPLSVGGWDDYGVIERMKKGKPVIIHGDGTSLWTMTHAEDFAVGFTGLLGREAAIGHTFHITSDEVLTWNQIYRAVARAAGCEPPFVHIASETLAAADPSLAGSLLGDKSHSAVFDNTKIKRIVPEFTATIPFEEGIRRTIAWFESDETRRRINPGAASLYDRMVRLAHPSDAIAPWPASQGTV